MKIETRVGLIQATDNRFLGASVFEDLYHRPFSPFNTLLAAFGVHTPSPDDREALRLLSLIVISPDARVWPLKLCRLLSSYGSPLVGTFAAQLVLMNPMMGPAPASASAGGLLQIEASLAAGESPRAAFEAWKTANRGKTPGFGVPFREQDERLVALRRFITGTPLAERRHWHACEQILRAAEAGEVPTPNILFGIAAVLLDIGVHPDRIGLLTAQLMQPVYVAHALEAAQTDAHVLRHLPADVVDDQCIPPRQTADGTRAKIPRGLRRARRHAGQAALPGATYADAATGEG